jgi:hypothetical protein
MLMRMATFTSLLVLAAGCATTPTSTPTPMEAGSVDPMTTGTGSGVRQSAYGLNSPLSRAQVGEIARRADSAPLGSFANPVRANQPPGQRAYIGRLRCSDGSTPQIMGRYSGELAPYGSIVDHYGVRCGDGSTHTISIDMYHDWVENRAVPGFTIVP